MSQTRPKTIKAQYINKQCMSVQHEDNYQLINMLLPVKLLENAHYKSKCFNQPQLNIQVINQYKYTTELEFSYLFEFGKSETISIKLYHDAKVAEIVYCTDVQQFIRLMGPKICPKIHKETRSVLNNFLNKWLNFLLNNGYNSQQWIQRSTI
ncbi:MAG: DUF1249 domain-containing protein [Proteobacteria bacterium]|nr:DUF1249 domain-containing protein [Pseudomonadota bacterium]